MAKSFVMQLASLITLFISIPAFIALVFAIINLQFPDAAEAYWQISSAESSIRYAIAILVIFFPAYLYLTRRVNEARRGEGALYHTLTKWLIYLALLVAGLTILGDLAMVVYYFLNGEITTRFLLKAAALVAIIGSVSAYYALDARDHWQERERDSIMIGWIALAVVLGVVIAGYLKIDAPTTAREIRIDQEQITELQDIQWRVEAYYAAHESVLPPNIETVYDVLPAPAAPVGRAAYEYVPTGRDTYRLCAEFAERTPESERYAGSYGVKDPAYAENQNWEHPAGRHCFDRRIVPAADPSLRP